MWGLFFSGLFLTIPVVGHEIVLYDLTGASISAVEGAVVVSGLSTIGAAISSIGIPKDSVRQYETVIEADDFLVVAHGGQNEVKRARGILATTHPKQLEMHLRAPSGLIAHELAPV